MILRNYLKKLRKIMENKNIVFLFLISFNMNFNYSFCNMLFYLHKI